MLAFRADLRFITWWEFANVFRVLFLGAWRRAESIGSIARTIWSGANRGTGSAVFKFWSAAITIWSWPVWRIQRRLFKTDFDSFHDIGFWINPDINLARAGLHCTFLGSSQM